MDGGSFCKSFAVLAGLLLTGTLGEHLNACHVAPTLHHTPTRQLRSANMEGANCLVTAKDLGAQIIGKPQFFPRPENQNCDIAQKTPASCSGTTKTTES